MNTNSTEFWDKYLAENYGLLKKIVLMHFPDDPDTANEALSYVSEKLLEDNKRRLRLYTQEKGASVKTYFCIVARQLVKNFKENQTGRLRFPKWVREQNNFLLWLVYKHLCWERMSESDVVEYLGKSAPGGRSESAIREAVSTIRMKYPDCGKPRRSEISLEENDCPSTAKSPEQEVLLHEQGNMLKAILNGPGKNENPDSNLPEIKTVTDRLAREFNPGPEQRLFLRMIYQDGMSVAAAGRQLGWNKNQAAGHNRRLITRLRDIIRNE